MITSGKSRCSKLVIMPSAQPGKTGSSSHIGYGYQMVNFDMSPMSNLNPGRSPCKYLKRPQSGSIFDFIRNNLDQSLHNPCDSPMVRKQCRERVVCKWKIIEKETVDEIIFRTTKPRNRLMLELMARGGMRIGEVLKLRLKDLQDRKLIMQEPKSGRENELVFIP